MKQFLSIALAASLLLSCNSVRLIPIKGSYPNPPFITQSDKDFEDTWDKAIDLFAQNGLSIRLLDKSSGLIISSRSSLIYTREKKSGELTNKDAWIVVDRVENKGTNQLLPVISATGEWNMRIKKGKGERPLININLVNIEVIADPGVRMEKGKMITIPVMAKSTGVFEKMIANKLLN